jgi:hypothetical protein
MKYLKLFENNEFYTEIDMDNFYDKLLIPCEKFTTNEIFKIEQLLDIIGSFNTHIKNNNVLLFCGYNNRNRNRINLNVAKCEDEWFLVCCHTDDNRKNDNYFYYKCDQWDGLMKCLKEVL